MAFDRLVQGARRHPIGVGQVGVEQDLATAKREDDGLQRTRILHVAVQTAPPGSGDSLGEVVPVCAHLLARGTRLRNASGSVVR